jgi:hypothetical protein
MALSQRPSGDLWVQTRAGEDFAGTDQGCRFTGANPQIHPQEARDSQGGAFFALAGQLPHVEKFFAAHFKTIGRMRGVF